MQTNFHEFFRSFFLFRDFLLRVILVGEPTEKNPYADADDVHAPNVHLGQPGHALENDKGCQWSYPRLYW